jgi:heme-degrading monooxygenase HmoA
MEDDVLRRNDSRAGRLAKRFGQRTRVPGRSHPQCNRLRAACVAVESQRLRGRSRIGVAMVARLTHYRIRPGKVEEFTATVEPLIAAMDKLPGFRVLLVLRGEDPDRRDATAISVWDSAADLKNSDNDAFYYNVLARLLSCCESFSPMHQQEVLMSKFGNK